MKPSINLVISLLCLLAMVGAWLTMPAPHAPMLSHKPISRSTSGQLNAPTLPQIKGIYPGSLKRLPTLMSRLDRLNLPGPESAHPITLPVTIGERWVYGLSWNFVELGTGQFEIVETYPLPDRRIVRARSQAWNEGWIRSVFAVDDEIESWFDGSNGESLAFYKDINEGRRSHIERIFFDPVNHQAYYHKIKKNRITRDVSLEIPPQTLDPLSCLMVIRQAVIEDRFPLEFPVTTNRKTYHSKVLKLGEESLDVKGKSWSCLLLKPEFEFDGLFFKEGDALVWCDKKSGMPVQMNVDIALGSITVRLREWPPEFS